MGGILVGAIGLFYGVESRAQRRVVAAKELASLERLSQVIARDFELIVADLKFLTAQNELFDHFDEGAAAVRPRIAAEYLAICRERRIYDQIRLLDAGGNELVRVDFRHGHPAVVPPEGLQAKGQRYYFRDTFELAAGEIFVSPFDLNIEQGQIEIPFKPMIRFGSPVFDRGGRKRGVVILNYLGDHLIRTLRDTARGGAGAVMLVNPEGYWLCSPDAGDEWGFMLKERSELRFGNRYSEAWSRILKEGNGQFSTAAGLFTFATVHPLVEGTRSSTGAAAAFAASKEKIPPRAYFWKLVSHVSETDLKATTGGLMWPLAWLSGALLLLALVPAALIAESIVRRRHYRETLWLAANFDQLTGLANRTLFREKLNQTIAEAKRYEREFALLFIDLDGFKAVNDAWGHAAGDLLLQKVARRLRACLRQSDMVARMGGDEFTVILPEIFSRLDVEKVARKVIAALSRPFALKGGTAVVGASVGAALYPAGGSDGDSLLRCADSAMYAVKSRGKNDIQIFPETE